MKIVVITDTHANLPALEALLKAVRTEGYDAIFHTGDAIAIGPYPAECLDLLLNTMMQSCSEHLSGAMCQSESLSIGHSFKG